MFYCTSRTCSSVGDGAIQSYQSCSCCWLQVATPLQFESSRGSVDQLLCCCCWAAGNIHFSKTPPPPGTIVIIILKINKFTYLLNEIIYLRIYRIPAEEIPPRLIVLTNQPTWPHTRRRFYRHLKYSKKKVNSVHICTYSEADKTTPAGWTRTKRQMGL